MKLYTDKNSEYLSLTGDWHAELSPWKAEQIYNILSANDIGFQNMAEVGCGAGEILYCLKILKLQK